MRCRKQLPERVGDGVEFAFDSPLERGLPLLKLIEACLECADAVIVLLVLCLGDDERSAPPIGMSVKVLDGLFGLGLPLAMAFGDLGSGWCMLEQNFMSGSSGINRKPGDLWHSFSCEHP